MPLQSEKIGVVLFFMDIIEYKQVSKMEPFFDKTLNIKAKQYCLVRNGKLFIYMVGSQYFSNLKPSRVVRCTINGSVVNKTTFMEKIRRLRYDKKNICTREERI